MKIYTQEISDGLSNTISNNNSISYASIANKLILPEDKALSSIAGNLSFASLDEKIFYTTKSILVTTCWNGNDDVFGPLETFAARKSPIHTFTNCEHDHAQIVGHITDAWLIDSEGNLIADDTKPEDLPEKFHIANAAVIYKFPKSQNKDAVARAEKLIEAIEKGEKYVSMECVFNDFGYAVVNPDGESLVVARNENTSFLTKHLRAYGGSGVYNNCKIGRFLKNLVFSGKGYVDIPANPESIIFSSNANEGFSFAKASHRENWLDIPDKTIVLIKEMENISMASEDKDMQKELDAAKAEVAVLQKQIADTNAKNLDEQITKLQNQVSSLEKTNSELSTSKSALEEEVKTLTTKASDLETVNKELSDKIAQAEQEKVYNGRVASLVEAGLSKDEATAKATKFSALSDEQFVDIVELVKTKTTSEAAPTETTQAAEETALETAEVVEDSAAVGSLNTDVAAETDKLMASISSLLFPAKKQPQKK